MTAQLTYGLKNDQLIHVDDVANGLACECVCANCKSPLVARNAGKKIAHHFAHHDTSECAGALETALHLLAKQVFSKKRQLTTPSVYHRVNGSHNIQSIEIYKSKKITFETVELEKRLYFNGTFIIPDAIGYIHGKPMFLVEFAHTHFIDEGKYSKIKDAGFICIEIDLRGIELDAKVIEEVLNSPYGGSWINYPELFKSVEQRANQKIKELENKQKLKEQRIKEREIKRKERSRLLLKTYSMDLEVGLFSPKKLPMICPLVQRSMMSFIDTKFYDHQILKRIIDGEYWNGKIYPNTDKYHSYGKYIFLKNEKIVIYPEEMEYDYLQQKQYDFFYHGIHEIIRVREKANCSGCEHCLDRIQTDDFETIIACGYSKTK